MPKLSEDEKFAKAVMRYALARIDYADLGAIPVFGQDAEEQQLINQERSRIQREHSAAWTVVMKFAPSRRA